MLRHVEVWVAVVEDVELAVKCELMAGMLWWHHWNKNQTISGHPEAVGAVVVQNLRTAVLGGYFPRMLWTNVPLLVIHTSDEATNEC
jgi:hypothetical protein